MADKKTYGAGAAILSRATGRFLLGLRAGNQDQSGTWCIFGGTKEAAETPEQTMVREVAEETGIQFNCLGVNPDYVYKTKDLEFSVFIVSVVQEVAPVLDHEHTDARWVCLKEMEYLPLHPALKGEEMEVLRAMVHAAGLSEDLGY